MQIVTDCAADMPPEELATLGITQAPLFIQFPEGEVNSADITVDEFYDRLESMRPTIPTTALPSSGVFEALFNRLAGSGGQILSIHISSGLSGTFNAARVAGEQALARVDVWDSMTLSGGQRFQVLAAAWASRAGWKMERVLERLEKIRAHTEVIYTLETLEYLAHGGRIGRVQALMGSVLKIKPIIRVDHADGKYSTVSKSRTIPQALDGILDHLQHTYAENPVWVNVLHGRFAQAADELAAKAQVRLKIARLEVNRISPVLGVHSGPGIVGAAVLPISLVEDLI